MEDTKMTAKEAAIAFKDWCDRNEQKKSYSERQTTEELFEHFMQEQNSPTDQTTKAWHKTKNR